MKQQINLYQPLFRKQKKVFTAMAMLQVCLIVIVLFIATGGYSYFQLIKLERQEAGVSANLARLQRQYQELEGQTGEGATSRLLTAEINRLKRELDQKKAISDLLMSGAFANTSGFSGHFEAIARQHVTGAWLTSIEIDKGGTSLNLNGITYTADLVPVYLQRLLQEQVFRNTTFNVLGMERSATKPEEISFQVRTQTKGKSNGSS